MGKWELGIAIAMATLVSLVLSLAGCGGGGKAGGGTGDEELVVIAHPGLESMYSDGLEPGFERSPAGIGVSFTNAFGPSGDLSGAVADGQPASVVNFEQAGEMERLVEAGVVDANWDKLPIFNGIAHYSVIVLIFRKGDPRRIHDVAGLLRAGVEAIVPNPLDSDAGRWGVMDVYATLIQEDRSEAEALGGVRELLEKSIQPESASRALAALLAGKGDVLLDYESDAIQAVEAGKPIRFVVPRQTMLVESPIAVTKDAPEPAARRFVKFLWSAAGQELWAENGYRPVDQLFGSPKRFPPRETLRIGNFGGWSSVNEEFFDAETGSVAKIEAELGIPTGS
jgi:ABC-type sulfate transport system substrate-binding protein